MRTIPVYVNLDELDLIIVCLSAAMYHGGVFDPSHEHVEFSEAGERGIAELVQRLALLNSLELAP